MYQGMTIKIFPDTDVDAYRRYIKDCGYSSSVHKDYIKVGKPLRFNAIDSVKLGKILKKVRTYKRITRARLSELISVDEDTIYRWETGIRKPTLVNLTKCCEVLGIDREELIDKVSRQMDM